MMSHVSDSLAPGFLFAVPQLLDPNFLQSVILLVDHTDDGSFGLVLNHESPILLEALCREQKIPYAGDPTRHVLRGGPVEPQRGFVLYGAEHTDPEGRAIASGIGISLSLGTLGRLCALSQARFGCFLGYAGWGPGQLTHEIAEGAWLTGPIDAAIALDTPAKSMWERGLRGLGIDPAALVPGSATEA